MAEDRPRFTVASAVYDVAPYLPEFIASIEGQDFDLARVEVVVVDDGSRDDSLAVLEAWAARRPDLVRVLSQQNAGQGAARNAGLAVARGEWITFADPDDVLDPNYLSTVDAFLDTHPGTVMVATNRLIWNEAAGPPVNSHPLRRMFSHDRLADLDVVESSFHGSAPAAFFDVDLLREHDVRFDERIRPNFEDGHFCASYLLHCARPLVGFLGSTRYHYRKRGDQSSSLQGSMRDPRRYTDVFEFGYLAILDEAEKLRGHVPLWLQHFLCYELLGYLVAHDVGKVPVLEAGPELEAFHDHVARVLGRCDLDRVLPRLEFGSRPEHRAALAHGYAEENWREEQIYLDVVDEARQLVRARYFFTGDVPADVISNGDVVVEPSHAKTRDLRWFGRVLVRERVLWVPFAPDLRLARDERWADLAFARPAERTTRVQARQVRRQSGSPSKRDRQLVARATPEPTTRQGRRAKQLAATAPAARRFADAWVLTDATNEVLFRRLRDQHPEINAWFVTSKGSPEWQRLRAEHGRRVVAHGSLTWRVLMAHCTHLVAARADEAVVRPAEITEFTAPSWRFTLVPPGVIAHDLSGELGTPPIDTLVTSTAGEHAAIAGDGSAYLLTTKEARLTGLPRFDRLLEVGGRHDAAHRDLVLVAPTWRRWLRGTPDLADTKFVRCWTELLASSALAEACAGAGATLAFLPHPRLPALPTRDLPSHVRVLDRAEADVDELVARARVVVTDYSSIAFDAAYLERPVVYLQFDADVALTGGHVGRHGWFHYERDGFGPATGSAGAAAEAIRAALDHGAGPAAPYDERMAAAFDVRDGGCSDRVIAALREQR